MLVRWCADGRLFLAFLFYGTYFANASAWSELSVTVRFRCSSIPLSALHLLCALLRHCTLLPSRIQPHVGADIANKCQECCCPAAL